MVIHLSDHIEHLPSITLFDSSFSNLVEFLLELRSNSQTDIHDMLSFNFQLEILTIY